MYSDIHSIHSRAFVACQMRDWRHSYRGCGYESTIHGIHVYLEIYMYLYMQESVRKWDFTCTTYDADRPRMPVASEGCSKFVFGRPKHVCDLPVHPAC